jgi:hypothetical protein
MTECPLEIRRGKPFAQNVKALRATQSALAGFRNHRKGFSPPILDSQRDADQEIKYTMWRGGLDTGFAHSITDWGSND